MRATIRRAGFFRRYLKDEQATAEAWAGGWFHTGDVVLADAEGYLHFIDRQKNVIRRSGENISAVEVETVLRRHPLVKDVAVVAAPMRSGAMKFWPVSSSRSPRPIA